MINRIMKRLQRPERGWDPIPLHYARQYADREYDRLDRQLVDEVEEWTGGIAGKRILDLGGGPGQYSIEMARRGARVFWHDISRNYLEIARARAALHNVQVEFSLDYMEDAAGEYDVVFNRVCWYYCINDAAFARKICALTRPGGAGYLIVNTERYLAGVWPQLPTWPRVKGKLLFFLNKKLSLKIGHIMPSHRKIERLFRVMRLRELEIGYREEMTLVRLRR